jgi:tRNA modification GTPase
VGHFGHERGEEVVVRRCADGVVELNCHGGLAAAAMIEDSLAAAGCQRMPWRHWAADAHDDPIAAAALQALAEARTERTAAILLDQYQGALRRALDEIQQAIRNGDAKSAQQQIKTLRSRESLGRHLVRPWRVVLAGPVNVGKSSLINALVGFGRSIVHDSPGTTRDAVTAATAIDGWPVELCDTAGLRDGCVRVNTQHGGVERAGMERARERLAEADLVVLVFARSAPWSEVDQTLLNEWPNALLVDNKCDLPLATGKRPGGVTASALHGQGIAELLAAISRRLVPDPPPPGVAVPFTDKQIEAVESNDLGGISCWSATI